MNKLAGPEVAGGPPPAPNEAAPTGLPEQGQAALAAINAAIRQAYEQLQPQAALSAIAALWEQVDEITHLAEARTRLLLGQVEPPPLAAVPSWLGEQLAALREPEEDLDPAHPLALEATSNLVRACLHQVGQRDLAAEVSKGPLGRVVVDWKVSPDRLQWLIEPAELPWPGVKVYVLARRGNGLVAQRRTRVFHNAFDVLDQFCEQLHP